MKKQNFISLLETPIMTISGCMNNDQIRIPGNFPYKYTFENKEIKAYDNMFSNTYSGSYILEVKENKKKIVYIGSGPYSKEPKLDYIEEKRKGPDRRHVNSLPKQEQEQRKKEYKQYI